MVQRGAAKSHNAIGINDHPGWLYERGLRVLRGLRKRYPFSYAASVELNSVATLSKSQRKRDQISFEHRSFRDKNLRRNVILLVETIGSLLSADGGWHEV